MVFLLCPLTPSGQCCMRLATATSRPAPGAPPARPSANAKPGTPPSPTPTPSPKKVDRGRLHPGRTPRAGGVVLRPGWPLPDCPPARPELAARGPARAATARVPPQRHGQGADAVPPRRRTGAPRGGEDLPQWGAAPLAEAGASGDPGRVACVSPHGADVARRVGTLAARAVREADVAWGTAPLTDAAGPGQSDGPQDAGVAAVAVRAGDYALVHTAVGQLAEHGREQPAYPEAAGVGGSAPRHARANHGLVRGGCR